MMVEVDLLVISGSGPARDCQECTSACASSTRQNSSSGREDQTLVLAIRLITLQPPRYMKPQFCFPRFPFHLISALH